MRTSILAVLLMTACSAPPVPPSDAGVVASFTAEKPMQLDANPKTTVHAEIYNDGVAVDEQRYDFALGAPYPQVLDVRVEPAYITRGCENGLKFGKERFLTLSNVTGDAAELSVVNGQLHVELKHEGRMSATLTGEIYDVMCERSGELKTTLPARHLVEIHVSEISKFSVTHVAQGGRCNERPMLLASSKPTSFPWVTAHDAEGALFQPMNAPMPVKLTVRSTQEIRTEEADLGTDLLLPLGRSTIELDTSLPVEGIDAFMIVGPSAVTLMTVEFGVQRANVKGSEWVPVNDDVTLPIYLPAEDNFFTLRSTYVDTTEGTLCSTVGLDWFEARSDTPGTCVATPGNGLQLAKIIAPGRCTIVVTMRDATSNWKMSFTTTN